MAILWVRSRPQRLRSDLAVLGSGSVERIVENFGRAPPRVVHMTVGRVLIEDAEGNRIEVFRDEISARQWALLRRASLRPPGSLSAR